MDSILFINLSYDFIKYDTNINLFFVLTFYFFSVFHVLLYGKMYSKKNQFYLIN